MHRIFNIIFIILFLCSTSIYSQVPKLINYQGYLNSAGTPLNGTYSIEFSLLNQITGGTYLWYETQDVLVNEGNFSVLLGSVTELTESLFSANELFLEIKIESEILSPRVQLTSVAYSFLAKNVEVGSIKTENIVDGSITQSKLSEEISFSPNGTAGGDLIGDYPNPIVQKLQGHQVSANSPNVDEVLKWNGENWIPSEIPTNNSTTGINSINGVSNDGGNIELVAGSNINLTPNDNDNTITISSSGGTGGGDITAVIAGDGLTGGGTTSDVTLNVAGGNGLTVSSDAIELNTTFTDNRYVNEAQTNSITTGMITPSLISSIDGVENDGGNIDLVAGTNISITPNNSSNTITISATGGGVSDNLGNHTATQNIKLNGNYLSGDGGNEGVYINNDGNVSFGADLTDLDYKIELGNKNEMNNYLRLHSKNYGGLLFFDGSITSKPYSGGISYEYATNSLLFDTKNPLTNLPSNKMTINGEGKVGIGTDLLYSKLNLGLTSESSNSIRISSSTYGGIKYHDGEGDYSGEITYYHPDDYIFFKNRSYFGTPTTNMILDKHGQLGIGANIALENLYYRLQLGIPSDDGNFMRISSKRWGGIAFHDGEANYVAEIMYDHDNDFMAFSTRATSGPTEKMRITSAGNLGIGSTNPSLKLYVNGTAGGTTSWNSSSDARLKTNINLINNALDKVLSLSGVYFDWKDTENYSKGRQMGFIAQDAEKIIPEVVEKEGEYYSMQYAPITAILVEAIKEQQKIINELNDRIKKLEKK